MENEWSSFCLQNKGIEFKCHWNVSSLVRCFQGPAETVSSNTQLLQNSTKKPKPENLPAGQTLKVWWINNNRLTSLPSSTISWKPTALWEVLAVLHDSNLLTAERAQPWSLCTFLQDKRKTGTLPQVKQGMKAWGLMSNVVVLVKDSGGLKRSDVSHPSPENKPIMSRFAPILSLQTFDLYSENLGSHPSVALAVPFALLQVVLDQKLLNGGMIVQSRLLLFQVLQKLLPLPLILSRLPWQSDHHPQQWQQQGEEAVASLVRWEGLVFCVGAGGGQNPQGVVTVVPSLLQLAQLLEAAQKPH